MSTLAETGALLKRARQERGISQRDLGAAVGVKQQQIARWESTGYLSASLERVDAVARALQFDVCTPLLWRTGLLAEEPSATYAPRAEGSVALAGRGVEPVRDLVDIIARVRAHGQELKERFSARRIGVYGSFVSGSQSASSDVDLLVELDDVNFDTEFGAAARLQELLGRKVDLALPSELDPRLRDKVLSEVIDVWTA